MDALIHRNGGGKRPEGPREPEEIGKIISRWLSRNRVKERIREDSIYNCWKEIVGEEIGSMTRVALFAGGVIVIEVFSAPLLTELSMFRREEILDSIRTRPGFQGVREIRFRAGTP